MRPSRTKRHCRYQAKRLCNRTSTTKNTALPSKHRDIVILHQFHQRNFFRNLRALPRYHHGCPHLQKMQTTQPLRAPWRSSRPTTLWPWTDLTQAWRTCTSILPVSSISYHPRSKAIQNTFHGTLPVLLCLLIRPSCLLSLQARLLRQLPCRSLTWAARHTKVNQDLVWLPIDTAKRFP